MVESHHDDRSICASHKNTTTEPYNDASTYPSAPSTQPVFSARSRRRIRIPARYKDHLPSSATPLAHIPNPAPAQRQRDRQPPPITTPAAPAQHQPTVSIDIQTEPNEMGLYRAYKKWPTLDPDDDVALADVCDSAGLASSHPRPLVTMPNPSINFFAPFLNATVFRLMNWWCDTPTKSAADLDRLVHEVLLQEDFDQDHLRDFKCLRETKRLDSCGRDKKTRLPLQKGWRESTVKIHLPAEQVKNVSESKAPEFEVSGVYHRSLVEIIKDVFQDTEALTYHYTPFQHFWKPSEDRPAERLYSEVYSSDAMLDEYDKLCTSPSEPGCNLERVIAPLMLWSDSTHLTNFGNSYLWPIYLQFGNQSKYLRAKPKSYASHHLAYIPCVS